MKYEKLKYSSKDINSAGEILKNKNSSKENTDRALKILNNFRASHSYPLHIFQVNLKNNSLRRDKKALISQRLKRVSSVIKKLNRVYGNNSSIRLFQIQDIAGCRTVVKNYSLAEELFEFYIKGRNLKHNFIKSNDYVTYPKDDGYRSFHIVYEFKSDKAKKDYNGRRIEIQIRTQLQHLWATAVETVDFFTRQHLKLSEGNPEWEEFFRLVSSAFAIKENCPIVNKTPSNKKELYSKIREKEKQLDVINKLTKWDDALRLIDEKQLKNKEARFFLLELDISREDLFIQTYKANEEEEATKEYAKLEKKYKDQKDYDIVLVGVDAAKDLKKAYPNYFIDTKDFVKELKEVLGKKS
jgi:ppGpp synthetase/RelA/SpoT-type nucleotidyltranferase